MEKKFAATVALGYRQLRLSLSVCIKRESVDIYKYKYYF